MKEKEDERRRKRMRKRKEQECPVKRYRLRRITNYSTLAYHKKIRQCSIAVLYCTVPCCISAFGASTVGGGQGAREAREARETVGQSHEHGAGEARQSGGAARLSIFKSQGIPLLNRGEMTGTGIKRTSLGNRILLTLQRTVN